MNSSAEPIGTTTPPASVEWSVMIPTYRPDQSLKEALLSALAALERARVTAQVEVVDDASPEMDVCELLRGWGIDSVNVHRRAQTAAWVTCGTRA
jgi:hypothetical protein